MHHHVVWLGLKLASDQRLAMRFLRKHLQAELTRRSPQRAAFELQKQSHDRVLRAKERWRGAFASACYYVLDNPRRKGLVAHPRDWLHLGAVIPGYSHLYPLADDFWPLFWKLYLALRDPIPVDPIKPPPP